MSDISEVKEIKILKKQNLLNVNNKMIADHKIFAFIFDAVNWIPFPPEAYNRDGFRSLIADFYTLYHDRGMSLLQIFCPKKNLTLYDHLKDSIALRCKENHDPTSENIEIADKVIEKIFQGRFSSYNDFYIKASCDDWKTLMEKLISDSNDLYDRLCKIADGTIPDKQIKNDFPDAMYGSMDPRFCKKYVDHANKLFNVTSNILDLKDINKRIKNNEDSIKDNIFNKFMNNLNSGQYKNTEDIHNGMAQIFAYEMQNIINSRNINMNKFNVFI